MPTTGFFGRMQSAAVNLLVARGYDRKQAARKVRQRLERPEVETLLSAARGRP